MPGEGCIGRIYYWYDSAGVKETTDNYEMCSLFSEYSNKEWWDLVRAAFARGEAELTERLIADDPVVGARAAVACSAWRTGSVAVHCST